MMQTVKTIKLSGSLGRRFGVFHELAVESYPEAIRALSVTLEGFKDYMQSEVGSRMRYAVFVDGRNVGHHDEKPGSVQRRSALSRSRQVQNLAVFFRLFWVRPLWLLRFYWRCVACGYGGVCLLRVHDGRRNGFGRRYANDFAAARRGQVRKSERRK